MQENWPKNNLYKVQRIEAAKLSVLAYVTWSVMGSVLAWVTALIPWYKKQSFLITVWQCVLCSGILQSYKWTPKENGKSCPLEAYSQVGRKKLMYKKH